jgi:hypothetical protein
MVVSPDFRLLRARGRKHGRCVRWSVLEIAEFLSRDEGRKNSHPTHLQSRGNAGRTSSSRRHAGLQTQGRPNATRVTAMKLIANKGSKE